jgi:hypothetical protein
MVGCQRQPADKPIMAIPADGLPAGDGSARWPGHCQLVVVRADDPKLGSHCDHSD